MATEAVGGVSNEAGAKPTELTTPQQKAGAKTKAVVRLGEPPDPPPFACQPPKPRAFQRHGLPNPVGC